MFVIAGWFDCSMQKSIFGLWTSWAKNPAVELRNTNTVFLLATAFLEAGAASACS